MSVTQRMTELAELAAERYNLALDSWRSIYSSTLNSQRLDQSSIAQATTSARRIADSFKAMEETHISDDLDGIASEAYTATLSDLGVDVTDEFTEAVSDLLSAIEHYVRLEIAIQIERDLAFLEESLRRTLLQVTVASRATGTTPRMALLQYQMGNGQELQFFFHDRRGAKWPSRKFIRGVYRHALLTVYNETVLLTLSDHGIREAEVVHASPKSAENGMMIAMSPNGEYPIYSEVRNEIFHPNADAILRKAA